MHQNNNLDSRSKSFYKEWDDKILSDNNIKPKINIMKTVIKIFTYIVVFAIMGAVAMIPGYVAQIDQAYGIAVLSFLYLFLYGWFVCKPIIEAFDKSFKDKYK